MRREVVVLVALTLAACSSGASEDTGQATSPETSVAAEENAATTTTASAPASTTTAPPSNAGAGASGEAVLTVGEQTYQFDNYYCRAGSANTGNPNSSFSSGAFGEVEGNQAQLDASIYDPSAEDRMEGDGVVASVTFFDVADFSNPKVAWSAESGMQATPVVFEFDGTTLRVETTFDDVRTEEIEEIPGVLEATCGQ